MRGRYVLFVQYIFLIIVRYSLNIQANKKYHALLKLYINNVIKQFHNNHHPPCGSSENIPYETSDVIIDFTTIYHWYMMKCDREYRVSLFWDTHGPPCDKSNELILQNEVWQFRLHEVIYETCNEQTATPPHHHCKMCIQSTERGMTS